MRCDFCNGPLAVWVFPCQEFECSASIGGVTLNWDSVGGWAACWSCGSDLFNGHIERLAQRWRLGDPKGGDPGYFAAVKTLHIAFLQFRLAGPPERIAA
jgi:hypothetical protein